MQKILLFFLLFTCVSGLLAFKIHHPEEKSMILEGEHFVIFFSQGKEELAERICNHAENAYQKQRALFKIDLDSKTPIIIKSHDEFSFGEADFFTDSIIINEFFTLHNDSSLSQPYYDLIGHELAHIFTFKLLSRRINFLKRMVTLGFMPMWLIEGIAQYAGEDWLHSHEAYMRSISMDDCFLTLHDLCSFYYFNLENRHRGYMESFAFVKYIFEKVLKEKSLPEFLTAYSQNPLKLDTVFLQLCDKNTAQLYKMYKDHYRKRFQANTNQTEDGINLEFHARYARYPRFSPDGQKLAFIGDEKKESYRTNNLFICDLKAGTYKMLLRKIDPFYDFSPGSRFIIYSHTYFSGKERKHLSDIFIHDLKTNNRKRITDCFSARYPCFIDDERVAYVKFHPSGSSLWIHDLATDKKDELISSDKGYFFYGLRGYSDYILASSFDGNVRQAVRIDLNSRITPLTNFPGDNRLPMMHDDGCFFLSSESNKYTLHVAKEAGTEKLFHICGDFDKDILEYDIKDSKLAITTYGCNGYTVSIHDLDKLTCSPYSFDKTQETKNKHSFEFKYPIHSYRERMKMTAFTPWAEYDDEARLGVMVAASDFLSTNQFMAKLFYNVESERMGEEFSFVSRSFPFVTHLSYENNVYNSKYGTSDYLKRQQNLAINLEYPLNPKEMFFWGLENKKISSVELDPPIFPLPFQGKINLFKAGYKFFKLDPSPDWDINPRGGRYLRLELRKADEILDSDVDFVEYRFLWDEYYALKNDPQTLFFRVGFGEKRKISNINTPILYGVGGVSTVRGFDSDTRFGTKYAIGKLEYRFPIKTILIRPRIGYFYLNKLFGAAFMDTANAWYDDLEYDDFLSSAGVELRLKSLILGKTPVISRLGFAQKISNGSGLNTYIKFELPGF